MSALLQNWGPTGEKLLRFICLQINARQLISPKVPFFFGIMAEE